MSLFRGEAPALGQSTTISQASVNGQDVKVPVYAVVVSVPNLAAASTSQTAFVSDGAYKFEKAVVNFGTASSSGTLQLEHATGTQAVGGGTNMLQATMSLAGTANTPLNTSTSGAAYAPVTNINTLTLAAGDRVNLIFGGTMTSLANCNVTLYLSRV